MSDLLEDSLMERGQQVYALRAEVRELEALNQRQSDEIDALNRVIAEYAQAADASTAQTALTVTINKQTLLIDYLKMVMKQAYDLPEVGPDGAYAQEVRRILKVFLDPASGTQTHGD